MQAGAIDTKKYKDIVIIIAIVLALIILIPLIKSLAQGAKDLFNFATVDVLGISNSAAKAYVNKVYATGNFPLFPTQFAKMQVNAPASAISNLKTIANYRNIADQLWGDMGVLTDNTDDAIAVFDDFHSQYSVALFAKVFSDYKGRDLFQWMRKSDTLFSQGFNAETVYAVVKKVESLPKY